MGASGFPRPQMKGHHSLPCSASAWLQPLGWGWPTGPQGAKGGEGELPSQMAWLAPLGLRLGRRPLDGPVPVFIPQPVLGEGLRMRRSDPGSNPAPSSETDLLLFAFATPWGGTALDPLECARTTWKRPSRAASTLTCLPALLQGGPGRALPHFCALLRPASPSRWARPTSDPRPVLPHSGSRDTCCHI